MTDNKKVNFAFTVVQDQNGVYQVLKDGSNLEVERQPTMLDIKVACMEIKDAVVRNDAINSVLTILSQKEANSAVVTEEAEEVSAPEAE